MTRRRSPASIVSSAVVVLISGLMFIFVQPSSKDGTPPSPSGPPDAEEEASVPPWVMRLPAAIVDRDSCQLTASVSGVESRVKCVSQDRGGNVVACRYEGGGDADSRIKRGCSTVAKDEPEASDGIKYVVLENDDRLSLRWAYEAEPIVVEVSASGSDSSIPHDSADDLKNWWLDINHDLGDG